MYEDALALPRLHALIAGLVRYEQRFRCTRVAPPLRQYVCYEN